MNDHKNDRSNAKSQMNEIKLEPCLVVWWSADHSILTTFSPWPPTSRRAGPLDPIPIIALLNERGARVERRPASHLKFQL
jgi:hypothetical protein